MPPPTQVLATIPVGLEPRSVAIAPDGSRAYVTLEDPDGHAFRGALAIVDTGTNTLTTTVKLGHPGGVALSPDGSRAYVPNFDKSLGQGVLSVIDTGAAKLLDTIAVSGRGGNPQGVAVTLDGRHVYVPTEQEADAPEGQGKVSVIDVDTKAVATTIPIDPFPSGAAIRPDGRFVYVLATESGPEVIDTTTHELTIPIDTRMETGIAFTPDGKLAYGADSGTTDISVVDLATNRVIQVLLGPDLPTGIAIAPDGRHVYVTQRQPPEISVVETGSVVVKPHSVTWSGGADGIAIMPDGLTAYVTDRRSRAVHVVPLA